MCLRYDLYHSNQSNYLYATTGAGDCQLRLYQRNPAHESGFLHGHFRGACGRNVFRTRQDLRLSNSGFLCFQRYQLHDGSSVGNVCQRTEVLCLRNDWNLGDQFIKLY